MGMAQTVFLYRGLCQTTVCMIPEKNGKTSSKDKSSIEKQDDILYIKYFISNQRKSG